jgi:hypothetical protein
MGARALPRRNDAARKLSISFRAGLPKASIKTGSLWVAGSTGEQHLPVCRDGGAWNRYRGSGFAEAAEDRAVPDLDNFHYFAKYRNMNLVFKALSDPTRRQILQLLRKKPMNAGELAEHFPIAKSTLSAHFAILREADLVETVGIGLPASMPLKKATGKAK